jgi:hypothetical protein
MINGNEIDRDTVSLQKMWKKRKQEGSALTGC